MLSRILAFSLLLSVPAFAADDCSPTVVDPNLISDLSNVAKKMNVECPNHVDAAQLCNAVGDQLPEQDSSQGTRFNYQTRIYKAACVQSGDSPSVIQAKIQNFWNKYHDQLTCSQLGFSVKNGNILKLAVERNSRDFINDAVRRWKVNLNHVDQTDKKTVLDYISNELSSQKGTSNEAVLQRYFDLFKANGAKLSREL